MKFFHPKRISRSVKEKVHNIFFYYILPDKWEIKYRFKKKVGYSCNLKNPKSFNEKIQWIKLHDRNPLYPKLIDKINVKTIVANELGSEYVIPMIGESYSSFSEIPFNELPNQFVLKCNHDAASTIICKDKSKFDYSNAKMIIEKALKTNYYNVTGKQWGYKEIVPKVFVEKYMQNGEDDELCDYKFMMFNGKCKSIFFMTDRYSSEKMKMNCYDPDWNLQPFTRGNPNTNYIIQKPNKLKEMLEIVDKLASIVNNAFVRIDLYVVNEKIYFGEYTFYPNGGYGKFDPQEWDYIMGSWIDLSALKR